MARLLAMGVALLLCGCGATAQPEVRTLPNVADLDRMASGAMPGGIFMGSSNTGFAETPDYMKIWATADAPVQYIIWRFAYDPASADQDLFVDIPLSSAPQGLVHIGVADFAADRWNWQGYEGPHLSLRHYMDDVQPWSEASYAYVCVIVYGDGAVSEPAIYSKVSWLE